MFDETHISKSPCSHPVLVGFQIELVNLVHVSSDHISPGNAHKIPQTPFALEDHFENEVLLNQFQRIGLDFVDIQVSEVDDLFGLVQ